MLLVLLTAFALSQSYRTTAAILAPDLQSTFGLSAQSLGAFAGLFGFSFAVAQLLVGVSVDVYGLRRTILSAFLLAVAGAVLSALAPSYAWLMAGQLLIGIGCSPAFLVCTVFIARYFASDRFAFFSGICLGMGGLGLLFTGTPLAWVVQHQGWRAGFFVLAALSVLSWVLIFLFVHEPPVVPSANGRKPAWGQAFAGFAHLLTIPCTWGILILGFSCYAAYLTLRGLWLGPLLIDRFHFTLIDSGNVALALSFIALFTPGVFGRLDPGPWRRRTWLARCSTVMALIFVGLALVYHPRGSVALMIAVGLLQGYTVLQFADVRSSYAPEVIGRALSLFTMSLFLGAATMQSITGVVATWASGHGLEPYRVVMLTIAVWLGMASLAFRFLPASPRLRESAGTLPS